MSRTYRSARWRAARSRCNHHSATSRLTIQLSQTLAPAAALIIAVSSPPKVVSTWGAGYGRTTARDIAAAAGVSLAAIGYHFGSKETLLNAALMQATMEWGEELERALATETDPEATPMERSRRRGRG
ncbi:MAG: TetR family transcriptional regulator [Pseudonocardiaceae bacterium]